MQVVIIEDEVQVALNIRDLIERIRPDFKVKTILDSIESALDWFSENAFPDLIFSDIQLGDGLSFEIFKKIKVPCPIIFCTAFDEYAIQAFKNNGIDYLLKPITEKDLSKSLEKIEVFKKTLSKEFDQNVFQRILKEIETKDKKYKNTFLVSYRDKLIPVESNEIKLFRIVFDQTQIITSDNKRYQLSQSLDVLEKQLNPQTFYRANRQTILSFKAIKEVANDLDRKLKVFLNLQEVEPIQISKAKASDFLRWMGDR